MKKKSSFLWGAATSSHQIEGFNEKNDWWAWEGQGRVEGGVRSGAATDHWRLFKEDLELAAKLGLNSYRFSVEWSRLEPEPGVWDQAAFDWYDTLITECERLGLMPMLTLHHFTLPLWISERGGFVSDGTPQRFQLFTQKVVEAFGARVPLWCTLNEPVVLALGSYLLEIMPPAENAPSKVSLALAQLLRSHVLAYDAIHAGVKDRPRTGPFREVPVQVGVAHNLMDFVPDRSWHPAERALAWVLRRFYNQSWLDAVVGRGQNFGVPGLIPGAPTVKSALGRRTVDFIGVNYYTKAYVQWRPRDSGEGKRTSLPLGIAFARRRELQSDLGWAVHPDGFEKVLRFASSYGLPLFVTENGIADHRDEIRSSFLTEHLAVVADLISEGIDIRGYFHWSLLDNFEWIKGFGPRFGLYQVDYDTFSRRETRGAARYRSVIESHRNSQTGLLLPPERSLLMLGSSASGGNPK